MKISERRLRALLEEGRIPARLVSGRWVIAEADLATVAASRLPGRPLSPRSAWQLAYHASGEAAWLTEAAAPTPVERHRMNLRLKRLLDSPDPLPLISSLLASRAQMTLRSCSPTDIPELRQDARIRLSGVSHSAAGLLSNAEVEAYVERKDLEELIRHWLLIQVASGDRPNVVLHVAPRIPRELPLMVVAADLADRPGSRERAAALDIVASIKSAW